MDPEPEVVFTTDNLLITISTGFAITLIVLISLNRKLRLFFIVDHTRRSHRPGSRRTAEEEEERRDGLEHHLHSSPSYQPEVDYEDDDLYSDYSDEGESVGEMDLEDDNQRILLDSLFNQMPNLWLRPQHLSMDYVYSLPTWKCPSSTTRPTGSSGSSEDYTTCSSEEELPIGRFYEEESIKEPTYNTTQEQQPQQKCCKTLLISTDESVINTSASGSPVKSSSLSKTSLSSSNHRRRKRRHFSRRKSIVSGFPTGSGKEEEDGSLPPSWMIEMQNCAFCLEDYCLGDELCGLPCAHNFHLNCLAEWLRRDQRCPVCRWPSYRFNHPRHRLTTADL